jgi:F-type H+-transporting ATPase subunit delta
MAELPRFLTRYQDMRQRLGKARTVIAESPQPLAAEDRKKLQTILEKKWGMDVSLEEQTVPSLIGGLRLRSGDWQFDASVRGRLERLAHHFTSTI